MKRRLIQAVALVAIAAGIVLVLPSCGGGGNDGKKQSPTIKRDQAQ